MSLSTHTVAEHRAIDRLTEIAYSHGMNQAKRWALRIMDVAIMAEVREGEVDTARLLERLRDAIAEVK